MLVVDLADPLEEVALGSLEEEPEADLELVWVTTEGGGGGGRGREGCRMEVSFEIARRLEGPAEVEVGTEAVRARLPEVGGMLAEEEEEASLDGREERERDLDALTEDEEEAEGFGFPSNVRGTASRSRRSFSHCSYCSSFLKSPTEVMVSKESSLLGRVDLDSNPPPLLPSSLPPLSLLPPSPETEMGVSLTEGCLSRSPA